MRLQTTQNGSNRFDCTPRLANGSYYNPGDVKYIAGIFIKNKKKLLLCSAAPYPIPALENSMLFISISEESSMHFHAYTLTTLLICDYNYYEWFFFYIKKFTIDYLIASIRISKKNQK